MKLPDTPDLKLNAVRDEIDALLKKNDLCGIVVLTNQDSMCHKLAVQASWSCARWEKDEEGYMGLLIQTPEHLPAEQKKELIENTLGMFFGLSDVVAFVQDQLERVKELAGRRFGVTHISKQVKE